MKKMLALFGLLFGVSAAGFAGTPMDVYFPSQAPISASTIIASTASPTCVGATYTLTVATPTAVNGVPGRNCFTKFVVQLSTVSVFTIANNTTTLWTINGLGLGATGTNTLSLPEDHLAPFCTSTGNSSVFTITNTNGPVSPCVANVEGFVTYGSGSTNNAGPMF